ncbi:hypothetical protein ABH930_000341 [Kitasatospora sp. GAS204A]|uniref:hypothetical protein n=1 Tax=unclassified Kitasatospora TaxID=2633591 RepID=UPI00247613E4|nr:hypothetical protein [Kitasatospora sp. GAS204B]MDH6116922.1 hypothetical protein [Kitasatospora sp. GAS204B]
MSTNMPPPPTEPHFGTTQSGHDVHLRTLDHHPVATRYQRLNKALAVWITKNVGTMSCFWLFTVLALLSLPATLHLMGIHVPLVPAYMLTLGFIYLITWICQNYIQLVLLPALMVGQNLQNEASDARSAKTFEDVEAVRGLLQSVANHLGVATPDTPGEAAP